MTLKKFGISWILIGQATVLLTVCFLLMKDAIFQMQLRISSLTDNLCLVLMKFNICHKASYLLLFWSILAFNEVFISRWMEANVCDSCMLFIFYNIGKPSEYGIQADFVHNDFSSNSFRYSTKSIVIYLWTKVGKFGMSCRDDGS